MLSPGARDNASEHYQWLGSYLQVRDLQLRVRLLLGGLSASMAAALLALLSGADAPRGAVCIAMMWIATGGGLVGASLWMRGWPTYRMAYAFGVITTVSTTLACLSHFNPLAALLGCFAFATAGAYLAFFQFTSLVVFNFGAAACVAVFQTARLVADGHVALAFVDLLLVLQTNLFMPLAILVLVGALKKDVAQADRDPLTGLLNRRGFAFYTQQMIDRSDGQTNVVAFLIDLDDFKSINDTYGHHVGDEVLVDVATALRAASPTTAAVARSGGEEFLVADIVSNCTDAVAVAERFCATVRGLRAPVTASVGIACVAIQRDGPSSVRTAVRDVVDAADEAMYQAKRAGGNRFYDSGQLTRPRSRQMRGAA